MVMLDSAEKVKVTTLAFVTQRELGTPGWANRGGH